MKSYETYKHHYAKIALKDMILKGYMKLNSLRIDIEPQFCMDGFLMFIPDLAIYDNTGLCALIEVVKSNPVSKEKRQKMDYYFFHHGYWPELIEIKADQILELNIRK